jgi:hypothetical protein
VMYFAFHLPPPLNLHRRQLIGSQLIERVQPLRKVFQVIIRNGEGYREGGKFRGRDGSLEEEIKGLEEEVRELRGELNVRRKI